MTRRKGDSPTPIRKVKTNRGHQFNRRENKRRVTDPSSRTSVDKELRGALEKLLREGRFRTVYR